MELKPLRQSSVPAGYKRTEAGVIPDEWEVVQIAEVADVKTGPFGSALHERDYVHDGTPIITVEHLNELGVTHFNLPMVSDADCRRLRGYSLEADDIVFSRVGSVDRNALIREAEAGWLFSGRLLRVRPNQRKALAPYLSHQFHSEPFKRRVRDVAVGQTMASLNTQILKKVTVVLPTILEQRAIAGALSDVDALIGALDQLIAKKRDLTQAAMQQLLTGQTRLPGFHGEWEVKRLGEIATIATGNTPPTRDAANYGDDFLFVSPVDLGEAKHVTSTEKKLSKKGFAISRRFPKDTILFVCIGSTIGKCGVAPIELTSNQQINAIFPSPNFSVDYLYYLLCTAAPKIRSLAGEQAVPIVNKTLFSETAVALPLLPEQTAIAEVLSDMDAELAALEQRRDKTRAIKQGMMQELLTGKTRLVDKRRGDE